MSSSDAVRACVLAALLVPLAGCGGHDDGKAAADAAVADAGSPAAGDAASPAPFAASASPAAAGAAPAVPGGGSRTLTEPDDFQLVLLGYRLDGKTPPLERWADDAWEVKRADEFKRPAVRQAELERLQGVWESTADVGKLRFNVSAGFGEYDAARGGFYLDAFTPGSYFDFSANPGEAKNITLRVDNTGELNFWPMDATAAQDVLRRTGGSRSVVLDSEFRILGVSQRGQAPEISLRLLRYTILDNGHDRQGMSLGERTFGQ